MSQAALQLTVYIIGDTNNNLQKYCVTQFLFIEQVKIMSDTGRDTSINSQG